MERRQVSTPKAFFESERDRFYSEWTLSFWRELFQNSVDAGAKVIDIRVDAAPSRGTFDDPAPELAEVTRIVFSDDGCGMTQDVLDRVYFSIGASTKQGGDSIGGYGRARLMTCFSNVRYSILTTDRFVIGDGPDWVNYDLGRAVDQIETALIKLGAQDGERAERALDGLRADASMVLSALAQDGYRGCRIEVDLDPTKGYGSRRPTRDNMLAKLREYLSESQLSPKVMINGETAEEFFKVEGRLQARRGPVRRTLTAIGEGDPVEFANVHLSEGAKAGHKGKAIVRVAGASMFVEDIAGDIQVIVELDPEHAREAMTSNRDGLRNEYRSAFQLLLQEIAVDTKSALRERKSERVTIEGAKGVIRAKRPSFDDLSRTPISEAEFRIDPPRPAAEQLTSPSQLRSFGLPIESIEAFMDAFSRGRSFLNDRLHDDAMPFREEFLSLRERSYSAGWNEQAKLFFSELPAPARAWLADILKGRYEREVAARADEAANRPILADLNDVVIHIENSDQKIRSAIRRNDPRNWDVASGKGRQPRALLVAWTEACGVAVEAMMKVRPSMDDFSWTTGWCYDVPKETHQGDRCREVTTRALFLRDDGGRLCFLVNPITDDARLAFNPSDAGDRQRLQALAMHEVSHAVESWHNETYAGVLTDIMEVYDFKEANRRMRDAVKAVQVAYDRGRARIQSMDDEPGVRPADRLLAIAAPGSHREGRVADVVDLDRDGTRVVDCTALHDREFEMASSFDDGLRQRYA